MIVVIRVFLFLMFFLRCGTGVAMELDVLPLTFESFSDLINKEPESVSKQEYISMAYYIKDVFTELRSAEDPTEPIVSVGRNILALDQKLFTCLGSGRRSRYPDLHAFYGDYPNRDVHFIVTALLDLVCKYREFPDYYAEDQKFLDFVKYSVSKKLFGEKIPPPVDQAAIEASRKKNLELISNGNRVRYFNDEFSNIRDDVQLQYEWFAKYNLQVQNWMRGKEILDDLEANKNLSQFSKNVIDLYVMVSEDKSIFGSKRAERFAKLDEAADYWMEWEISKGLRREERLRIFRNDQITRPVGEEVRKEFMDLLAELGKLTEKKDLESIATYFENGELVKGLKVNHPKYHAPLLEEWTEGFGRFYEGMKRGGTITTNSLGTVYLVPVKTRQWCITMQARKNDGQWKFLTDEFQKPDIFIEKAKE